MKIILASEDRSKLNRIQETLDPTRFEIEYIEDAYSAIDFIEKAFKEQIVLLDSPLPGMSPANVCAQVSRTALRWRSVLMMIVNDDQDAEGLEFLRQGGDGLLCRGSSLNVWRERIESATRLLGRHSGVVKHLKADAERYIPLEPIGSGGVSNVYRGIDRKLEREVAIKYLRSEFDSELSNTEAALQEARMMAKFIHPNLVTVFDFGESEEGAFVVMEIVDGESLQSMLGSGALRDSLFDRLVVQSLQGIDAAHSLGVLHLDLKPANMMFGFMASTGSEMNLKIVDFGIAQDRHQINGLSSLNSKTVIGSLPYIAPERFQGAPLGRRADLYSLGHIFYIALTGGHPFPVEGHQAMIDAHLYMPVPSIHEYRPEISPELDEWVLRFLKKNPEERFASALDALQAYQKINWEKKS